LNELIRSRKYIIYSILAIFVILLPRESLDQLLRGESLANSNYISEDGRKLALYINDFFDESELPSISVVAAGMAYKYKGETFDLIGLNNTKMAHANHKIKGFKNHDSFNKEVFFDAKPDFIAQTIVNDPENVKVDIYNDEFKLSFINKALDEIWFDKKFQEMYKPVVITKKENRTSLFTWARIQYLQKLNPSQYEIKDISYQK